MITTDERKASEARKAQLFYKTHAVAYRIYRAGCGRDARLRELWGSPH